MGRSHTKWISAVALMVLLATACATALSAPATTKTSSAPAPNGAPDVAGTEASPATVPPTLAASPVPHQTASTPTAASRFTSAVEVIDAGAAARMTASWRPGCPVDLDELRLVAISHHTFEGGVAVGELVVADDVADDVVTVFKGLFAAGYPIERMQLVDVYDGDDEASMTANNTSAFNCRAVAGTSRWSQHAYGRAIDINPLYNPHVRGSQTDPPDAAPYADRTSDNPALIHDGDAVVDAFAAIGWSWGGDWASPDYQHFSSNGR